MWKERQVKSRSKLVKAIFVTIPVFVLAAFSLIAYSTLNKQSDVSAVSATDFNAGNIISDSVFYNKDAMSAQQIQDFLNQLMPSCYPYGQNSVSDFNPPYVCLKDYYENPSTGENSFTRGSAGSFSGGISAAQIIYNAAQEYGINPQVLLVLLKKESLGPLTSDTWPVANQYKYAMGYACPDSGPDNTANCDSSKSGFYKQIHAAAWQFKYYKDHPNDYRYHIGWNDIQYSPNLTCGTKRVYIENIATLSLYIYTPYTPNDGALANYPGTANCGAYGNRNFFMFFSEWFGNPAGIPVYGKIRDRYLELGGESGKLGEPLDKQYCKNNSCFQQFENGFIIGKDSTGYWESLGKVRTRYSQLGYESGKLGYPVGPFISNKDGGGSQEYERGYLTGIDKTGYWESWGSVRSRYIKLGLNESKLGYPTGPEFYTVQSAVFQPYQKGYIIGNGKTGYWESLGEIRSIYQKLNYEHGKLGLPISGENTIHQNNGVYQNFQGGTIYYNGLIYDHAFGQSYNPNLLGF